MVGLTTFGPRKRTVFLTIESIGRGQDQPSRLILWLSEDDREDGLSRPIRRLQRRGLEVKYCPDYRSYKKIYPYATSIANHQDFYVTADDDVLYPRHWLRGLHESASNRPDVVCGYRGRRIPVSGNLIPPYCEWPKVGDDEPRFSNFLTGVSGVIYPPAVLDAIRDAGEAFLRHAPTADDVWLHHIALRTGFPHQQVASSPAEFPTIPFTQRGALMATNIDSGLNDAQILSLYDAEDLARLRPSEE